MNGTKVRDWMCNEPTFIHIRNSAEQAVDLMDERNLKVLPVVDDDNRFLGTISEGDVLKVAILLAADSLTRLMEKSPIEDLVTVRELMDKDVVTISADEEMSGAAAKLIDSGSDCLAVVEESKLVGTLNHADFTRMIASSAKKIRIAA
jgi:CBS domain-containing protein